MLYAIDRHGNRLRASRGVEGLCNLCGESLIAKCGEIKIHHWAHRGETDCDDWHEPESDWHLYWKSLVPPEFCEVIIDRGGKRRRADIVTDRGVVVELQHSPLSTQEVCARQDFYKNMIWLFDVRECCVRSSHFGGPRLHFRKKFIELKKLKNFGCYKANYDPDYRSFRWKQPRQYILNSGWDSLPVYLDLDDQQVFRLLGCHPGPPTGGWGVLKPRTLFKNWLIRACGSAREVS